MGRIERIRPLSIAVGVAVLIGFIALAIAFDWNWFKGLVERYASEVTGRPFAIRGDLDVDAGSVIRADAQRVFLGNAPWASSLYPPRAERVRVDIAPWPLLAGRWTVPPLVARAAVAVALYAIAPPAALLALIETGPGKGVGCRPSAA